MRKRPRGRPFSSPPGIGLEAVVAEPRDHTAWLSGRL
jgi:hypothetical protein